MYNPTEQFAEFNKVNVAQATKIAALSIENAEKLVKLNLNAAKIVFAQGRRRRAGRRRRVKDVQDLLALRTKFAETGVQTAVGYSRTCTSSRREAQAEFSALAEEAWSALHEGRRRVGRQGQQVGPGRLGRRRQRVQVDVRRLDRRVRPVPEGDEASREPRRRERPRRGAERDQGHDEGPQVRRSRGRATGLR